MKKKQIITLVASLSLVGAIAVGGTLAYLSAQSNEVVNTFTVGNGYIPGPGPENLALVIDEQDVKNPSERTYEGNDYKDLLPGDVLVKDPTVRLTNGSCDSYVFVKVEGIDALEDITVNGVQAFDVSKINDYFVKVDGEDTIDGIYACNKGAIVSVQDENKDNDGQYEVLGTLFDTVSMNFALTDLPTEELPNITVKACAVQAKNVKDAQAALALATFGE